MNRLPLSLSVLVVVGAMVAATAPLQAQQIAVAAAPAPVFQSGTPSERAGMSVLLAMGAMPLVQGGVEQALMDLERQWVKAASAGDGAALGSLLATDFVSLQADGTMQPKPAYVSNTSKGKWQVNEVSDMKVKVYGDTAVVTGIWTGKGTDGAGKAVDGRERFADTWLKMPGDKWQCVVSAGVSLK